MRRISAILLLLLFGLSLLSPLAGADSEQNLPACCRRAGLHHCAAPGHSESSAGPAWRAQNHCPMYPGFAPGTVTGFSLIPSAAPAETALEAAAVSCASFELRVLSSLKLRANARRGPPCSFSA